MDDRELLELAAKAAGMHKLTEWSDGIWDHDSPHYGYPALYEAGPGGACGSWNPLTDDGDALRLAVKLNIHHSLIWDGQEDEWSNVLAFRLPQVRALEEFCAHRDDQDEYQATRRAIVRVAAEIGRAM